MLEQRFDRDILKFCQLRDAGKNIIEDTKESLDDVRSKVKYNDFLFFHPLQNKSLYALKIKFLGYVFLVEVLIHSNHITSGSHSNELKSWRFSGRYKWSLILEDHLDPHKLKTDQVLSIWFNPDPEFWFQVGIDSPEDMDSIDQVDIKQTPRVSVRDDLESVIQKVFGHYLDTWPRENELSFSSLESNHEN